MPKTPLGKWSLSLIVFFFFSLALLHLFVSFGQTGGPTFFSNLLLAMPGLLAALSGISAFFTGLSGIIKSHERSPLVFLSTLIGLFVLIFCLGEVLYPH